MANKIYKVLNKVYAILMFASFFAGFLPVVPVIVALFIGGEIGPAIYDFCFNKYYPWVIAAGSVAILVGVIAMYVGKIESLSVKSMKDKENKN